MNDWHLRQAARALTHGGVIAYPTEAVYGLGCDPCNAHAVGHLLLLKGRPRTLGLILIAAEFAQLEPYLLPLEPAVRARVLKTWPGPVTWLLPARPEVPDWLRGAHETLAVRVTAHPIAAALCQAADMALVSTSANPHGRPPARSALAVRRYFPHGLDYIVHGPLGMLERPTPIFDGRTGRRIR